MGGTILPQQTHDRGLISILKQLHNDLDAAVFDAYGWPNGGELTDDQLLEKLVALNHQRAAEEKNGIIKYHRPSPLRHHPRPAPPTLHSPPSTLHTLTLTLTPSP